MSKLRISIGMICALGSVICAVRALPPDVPDEQTKAAKDKCDRALSRCFESCGGYKDPSLKAKCNEGCAGQWTACYERLGIHGAKPPRRLAPTAGGTLTTAQPIATATPRGLVRQPQGTLTHASPTPTPTAHEKKKN